MSEAPKEPFAGKSAEWIKGYHEGIDAMANEMRRAGLRIPSEEEIARAIYGAEYSLEDYPFENISDGEKLLYAAQARAVLKLFGFES